MQATYNGSDERLKYLFQNAKNVAVTQNVSSGTKIGTITIDGVGTDLYSASSVTCQPLTDEGSAVAIFNIGGTDYVIYCPVTSDVGFNGLLGDEIEVSETRQGSQHIVYNEKTYKVGTLSIQNGDDYRLTSDTTVKTGKTYYSRSDVYNAVTPTAGDNPVAKGWYELVSGSYVKSSDTTVVAGKTYYNLVSTYSAVTPQQGDNPSEEGWYEESAEYYPIYAPPAIGVTYESRLNSGYHIGDIVVRTIVNDPTHEENPHIEKTQTYQVIAPTSGGSGSVVSYTQIYPSTGTLIGKIEIDGFDFNIYAPSGGGSTVSYVETQQSGTEIGRITIDGTETVLYAPSGGGSGNVDDVYVNGSSVLDANHIAQIDLTSYATDSELATAIATLQASFQDGVDRIYEACVRKGSTPASHSLADVIDAIYAIGGNMDYRNVESTLTTNMRYFGHAREDV